MSQVIALDTYKDMLRIEEGDAAPDKLTPRGVPCEESLTL